MRDEKSRGLFGRGENTGSIIEVVGFLQQLVLHLYVRQFTGSRI